MQIPPVQSLDSLHIPWVFTFLGREAALVLTLETR